MSPIVVNVRHDYAPAYVSGVLIGFGTSCDVMRSCGHGVHVAGGPAINVGDAMDCMDCDVDAMYQRARDRRNARRRALRLLRRLNA